MSTRVNLDPVTGAVTNVKPCCQGGATGAAVRRAELQKFVLIGSAVAIVAGAAFAAYRYYKKSASSNSHVASSATTVSHAPTAYRTIHVSDPATFDAAVTRALLAKLPTQNVFILVEGAIDPATGKSWCSDCVDADPIIDEVFTEAADTAILVRADIDRAAYKSSGSHPYRTNSMLQLQRIPTLYKLQDGQVTGQLIETELHDISRVRKFVKGA